MRRFGAYAVQSIRDYDWLKGQGYNNWVYYRVNWADEIIAGPYRTSTEAEGLRWAKGQILYHKQIIEEIKKIT